MRRLLVLVCCALLPVAAFIASSCHEPRSALKHKKPYEFNTPCLEAEDELGLSLSTKCHGSISQANKKRAELFLRELKRKRKVAYA